MRLFVRTKQKLKYILVFIYIFQEKSHNKNSRKTRGAYRFILIIFVRAFLLISYRTGGMELVLDKV